MSSCTGNAVVNTSSGLSAIHRGYPVLDGSPAAHVEDDSALDCPVADHVVAATADCEWQAERPGERDRRRDVSGPRSRMMTAGRLSIMPFQTLRAVS